MSTNPDEAGFDALKGTEESRVSSALYTERVLVMAKGFIIHALANEVGGLDDVLKWVYLSPQQDKGPRLLREVIQSAKELLPEELFSAEKESIGLTNSDVVPGRIKNTRLSAGAKLVLRKHVATLEAYHHHALHDT